MFCPEQTAAVTAAGEEGEEEVTGEEGSPSAAADLRSPASAFLWPRLPSAPQGQPGSGRGELLQYTVPAQTQLRSATARSIVPRLDVPEPGEALNMGLYFSSHHVVFTVTNISER